jgi:hypothetical protein
MRQIRVELGLVADTLQSLLSGSVRFEDAGALLPPANEQSS